MPKMTAKYRGALDILNYRNLTGREKADINNQESVYQVLQENSFFWDSSKKIWEEFDPQEADEPTRLILIRVWADAEIVEDVSDDVTRKFKKEFELIEKSPPYPCRPPKQLESRVYLKFLPKRQAQR